jgi:hypothetical protein
LSVQAARAKVPPLSVSGGYLDIVKKGYARDVSSRQRLTYRLRRIRLIQRRLSSSGMIVCNGAGGSLTASRLVGFILMQLVFLWRCSPSREGAGYELALQA